MPDTREYLGHPARAQAYTGSAQWPAAVALWEEVAQHTPVNGTHWAGLAEARFEPGE